MGPQSYSECGRLGQVLERPNNKRVRGRNMEGETVPGAVTLDWHEDLQGSSTGAAEGVRF